VAKAYPPEVKAEALDYLRAGHSLTETLEWLRAGPAPNITKSAISKWAQAGGVDTVSSERTARAVQAKAISYGELVAELTDLLGQIATTGAKATLGRLQALVGEDGKIDLAAAKDEDLAKIVGSWTRAIHDLQLLSGKATERHDLGSDVDRQIEDLVAQMSGMDAAPVREDVYT
jgi:hypothetical protein